MKKEKLLLKKMIYYFWKLRPKLLKILLWLLIYLLSKF